MTEEERELALFRQGYYALLVSLFWREPPEEVLAKLREGIEGRAAAASGLSSSLGEGWEEIARKLAATESAALAEGVADEYTRLFLGPHQPEVYAYESFYLTGNLLDRPLAEVRSFLKAIGLERDAGYAEPEDFLAFELEVMRWLIGKQLDAESDRGKRWLEWQLDFLARHILVWMPACAIDIEKAAGAEFYRAIGRLLRGFLETERELLRAHGIERVASLEDVRARYRATPTWRGPTFEFGGEPGQGPERKN